MINPNLLALLQPKLARPAVQPVTPQAPQLGPAQSRVVHDRLSAMDKIAQALTGQQMGVGNAGMVADAGRQGLMQAGLALLAAPATKGSFGSNLASAVQTGMGAARGALQESEFDAALEGMDPGMRALVKAFGPGETARLMDVMRPVAPEPNEYTLPVGSVRYRDGVPVAANLPDDRPSSVVEYEYYSQLTPEGQAVWDRQHGRGPLVQNVIGGQDAYTEARAKQHADEMASIQAGARSAQTQIEKLNQLEKALSNPEVYQGVGAELVLNAKRLASALGMDVGDLSDAEMAQAISGEYALELRNPEGGAGMPGAMSDKDREFLQRIVPGLSKTREGNMKLIAVRRRLAKRNLEVQRDALAYERIHGRLDDGFYRMLDEKYGNAAEGDMFGDLDTNTPSGPLSLSELEANYRGGS